MYTIILFDEEDKKALDSIAVSDKPTVEGNNIKWTNGQFGGINASFIVLEGEIYPNAGDDISAHIPNDIKDTLKGEYTLLRQDLDQTQQVLNDMMLGGL